MNAGTKRTNEFDDKILELTRQGLSRSRIALQLPGWRRDHVVYRLRKLRAKPESAAVSTSTRWRASEDKVLMENREAGLSWEQMKALLPGRSHSAIRLRYSRLMDDDAGAAPRTNVRKRWTPEERQRVIDMILIDGLSTACGLQ